MSDNTTRPLVSIGLPTYNRPSGLKVALERITTQTYPALEIIVSDNHSDNAESIISIIDHFADDRIKFYRQSSNIGAVPNFNFVLQKSSGEFFMWAADDDYFESNDIVEKLLTALTSTPEIALVFPDFNFEDSLGRIQKNVLFNRYSKCVTAHDYITALCRLGLGNPVYGLYRKSIMTDELIALNYTDLAYFNEGVFIHSIFLNFRVKFVSGTHIRYFSSNVFDKISKSIIVKDFIRYSFRLIKLYGRSKLNFKMKCYCISFLLLKHSFSTFRFMLK